MATTHPPPHPGSPRPLRVWPGLVAVAVQWPAWQVLPIVRPEWTAYGLLGAAFLSLVVAIWWLFFSRAPWVERLGVPVAMAAATALTSRVVHPSVSNGMMGMMLYVFALPVMSLALVAAMVASRRQTPAGRRGAVALAIVLGCVGLSSIRTDGVRGEGRSDVRWRWTATAEQQLLADATPDPAPLPAPVSPADPAPAAEPAIPPTPLPPRASDRPAASAAAGDDLPDTNGISVPRRPEWPGFRGAARDGIVRQSAIATDWSATPPVPLWRQPVGPGWSSFAVDADLFYTQEQRGEDEVVACYRLRSGDPVWRHRDRVRFWESNGGAGPRATPTLHDGRVYTFGATGLVNALDARTGALLWTRSAAADTGTDVPQWGFAGSPLVLEDLVIVAAAGRLAAYDRHTGEPRWMGEAGGAGYSSPHLATIGGVPQVLLIRGSRTIAVSPRDGTLLWDHDGGAPAVAIVQPALTDDGVLIATGDAMGGVGTRRIRVTNAAGWTTEERWTSRDLKPYFNDFVVHKGHAFGFDGSILAAIDLDTGRRAWKGGRYGHGQLVLLADQDLLLVLSEDGEVALVEASPERFHEVARLRAIEGKTWNHPVLAGDVLLVRNDREMAAFRLAHRAR